MPEPETLEQIRTRVESERYTFWFSQQHADHYHMINQQNPTDYEGNPDPINKNFAVIDGVSIPYTCCTTVPNATEPFEAALERWPDYTKVAEGTIKNIRTNGVW